MTFFQSVSVYMGKLNPSQSIAKILMIYVSTLFFAGSGFADPLKDAIIKGDPDKVRTIINGGVSERSLQDGLLTSLVWRDKPHALSIIELLLDAGATPNKSQVPHLSGSAPILHQFVGFRSVLDKDLAILELLFDRGADPNLWARSTWEFEIAQPLHIAVSQRKIEMAKILIGRGAQLASHGELHGACYDVAYRALEGCGHQLTMAVASGSHEMVSMLLDAGVDVNGVDRPDPLSSSPISAMEMAIFSGQPDLLTLLIKHDGDIERGPYFYSLLTYAMKNNQLDAAKILLRHGALIHHEFKPYDVNASYYTDGYFMAAFKGHSDLIPLLIQNGADSKRQMWEPVGLLGGGPNSLCLNNAMHRLGWTENSKIVEALHTAGTSFDEFSKCTFPQYERTALMSMYETPEGIEVFREMIRLGANVNIPRPSDGQTPLMFAASQAWYKKIEILVANGANMYAKDANGRNALDWAYRPGNGLMKTLNLFCKAGYTDPRCKQ